MEQDAARGLSQPARRLADLTPDPQNANRGTARGREALARSLRDYGAGRGVLIDRDGRIIAGNKTVDQANALGLRLRVVRTDGAEFWHGHAGGRRSHQQLQPGGCATRRSRPAHGSTCAGVGHC